MKQDELKNIIIELFDDFTNGFDLYTNPNTDSIWGIFTDEKRWIFELTNDGTLWYNYNFFTSIFKYLSLDVTENQHYITEWVEDTIQNGVKNTYSASLSKQHGVEDTIQNGVKNTVFGSIFGGTGVEDTIQNGVKTKPALESHEGFMKGTPYVDKFFSKEDVEDTIENGTKESQPIPENNVVQFLHMVDTIDNGIINTYGCERYPNVDIKNLLKDGIKHTEDGDWLDYDERINDIIKSTRPHFRHIYNPMTFEPIIKEEIRFEDVGDVLKNGIKETIKDKHDIRYGVEDTIKSYNTKKRK